MNKTKEIENNNKRQKQIKQSISKKLKLRKKRNKK